MDGVCCNAKTCSPYVTTTEADKVTCSEATECKEAIKCQAGSFACPVGNALNPRFNWLLGEGILQRKCTVHQILIYI